MKTIPGQELQDQDFAELLREVDAFLFDLVYQPVVRLLRPSLPKPAADEISPRALLKATHAELVNAAKDEAGRVLKKALQDGSVQVIQGEKTLFAVAKPDRRISDALKDFGCRLNKTTGMWECSPAQVPFWVTTEAQGYQTKAREAHRAVKDLVSQIEDGVDAAIQKASFERGVSHAVAKVSEGWKATARKIEVVPTFGEPGIASLREGFARRDLIQIKSQAAHADMVRAFDDQTKKYVKVWAKESLQRLREQVDENAIRGYRAEGLAERIRNEYGVSKTRADLIARQETSNFMASFRRARATDAGLRRYVWTITRDPRVRRGHAQINGQTFTYERKAPARYMSSGKPCNPGEDFRCRCVDRPIIE